MSEVVRNLNAISPRAAPRRRFRDGESAAAHRGPFSLVADDIARLGKGGAIAG